VLIVLRDDRRSRDKSGEVCVCVRGVTRRAINVEESFIAELVSVFGLFSLCIPRKKSFHMYLPPSISSHLWLPAYRVGVTFVVRSYCVYPQFFCKMIM
jgi:hypothetical protein